MKVAWPCGPQKANAPVVAPPARPWGPGSMGQGGLGGLGRNSSLCNGFLVGRNGVGPAQSQGGCVEHTTRQAALPLTRSHSPTHLIYARVLTMGYF